MTEPNSPKSLFIHSAFRSRRAALSPGRTAAWVCAATAAATVVFAAPVFAQGKKDKGLSFADVEPVQAVSASGLDVRKLYTGSYAIIVGISHYRDSSKNLEYAAADATALRDVLVKNYDFPADHVTLLLNEKATKTNVENALSQLSDGSLIKEGDRVLVFFSGHGQTVKNKDGGDMGFLIPYDADVDLRHPENRSGYLKSCLRMDTIWGYLSASSARHALLIADACYGGLLVQSRGFAPERPSAPVLANLLARPALEALTAGGAGEPVTEDPAWGHGALTYKLLEELRAQAATPGSIFLASHLASALKTSVGNLTRGHQTPQFGSHDTEGDFVFYTVGSGDAPRLASVAATPVATKSADSRVHSHAPKTPVAASSAETRKPVVVVPLAAAAATVDGAAKADYSYLVNHEVTVKLDESLTSSDSKEGEKVRFEVDKDVVVDGKVVIPAETPGVGHVTIASRAGLGKGGKIEASCDYLQMKDGTLLALKDNKHSEHGRFASFRGGPTDGTMKKNDTFTVKVNDKWEYDPADAEQSATAGK